MNCSLESWIDTGRYETAEYAVQPRTATPEECDFWNQETREGGLGEFLTRAPYDWPRTLEISEEEGPITGSVYTMVHGKYEEPKSTGAEIYWYRCCMGKRPSGAQYEFSTLPWRLLWIVLDRWDSEIRNVRFEPDEYDGWSR